MKAVAAHLLEAREHRRVARIPLRPADMGVGWVHAGGEQANQRQRTCFGDGFRWPQAEALAEVGQDGGVLSDMLAIVEPQGRHPPLRMNSQIGFGSLFALCQIDALEVIFLAAFLEHDMCSEGTGARRIVELQHVKSLLRFPFGVERSGKKLPYRAGKFETLVDLSVARVGSLKPWVNLPCWRI